MEFIYIYQNWSNCKEKDGKNFGGPWTNAVYTIDKNDVSTLGTVSNAVDGERRQWPEKFLSAGANFTAVTGYTIEAEGGTTISGRSLDEYKRIAAGDDSIALFTTPNGQVVMQYFIRKTVLEEVEQHNVLVRDFLHYKIEFPALIGIFILRILELLVMIHVVKKVKV